jgi:maltase-glucoamylase
LVLRKEYGFYKTGEDVPVVTLRSIGGILDFHMFLGPRPADVTRQYLEMIGRPFLPPYWALGFQLCRWGYWTLDKLKAVVERTRAAGIPQDVQYADIDYMDFYRDFTYDKVNWAGFPEYVREVKEAGLHFVVILVSHIGRDKNSSFRYFPFLPGFNVTCTFRIKVFPIKVLICTEIIKIAVT